MDGERNVAYEPLLYAWRRLWNDIWDEYKDGQGKITSDDEIAETLARSFLDRYGRLQRPKQQPEVFVNDARNIASLFRSRKDLILSIRRAVGRWAKIGKLKRLNSERWPPWENAGRRRTNE